MLQQLVNNSILENNEFFQLYEKLINTNRNQDFIKYECQVHHVVPRFYFKYFGLAGENDTSNIVNLKHSDHVLAHYYLLRCAKASWFKADCYAALKLVLKSGLYGVTVKDLETISEEILLHINELDIYYNKLNAERISNINTGRISIHNGNIEKRVRPDQLQAYLDLGFIRGHLPKYVEKISNTLKGHSVSEETRHKIGERVKGCTPPNKGKTKETDEKIRHTAERIRQEYATGIRVSKIKGVSITAEKRAQIAETLRGWKTMYKDGETKRVTKREQENYLNDGWTFEKL